MKAQLKKQQTNKDNFQKWKNNKQFYNVFYLLAKKSHGKPHNM